MVRAGVGEWERRGVDARGYGMQHGAGGGAERGEGESARRDDAWVECGVRGGVWQGGATGGEAAGGGEDGDSSGADVCGGSGVDWEWVAVAVCGDDRCGEAAVFAGGAVR